MISSDTQKLTSGNQDAMEISKFSDLADSWWQIDGPFKTLHDINPVRIGYIEKFMSLPDQAILDVGCGGGILSEALSRKQATVTGIDASVESIKIAEKHAQEVNLSITYKACLTEDFASTTKKKFDAITCMELLEHVPEPESLIENCCKLLKPGGHIFFSTINRNLTSYLFAILAAERVFRLLPANTHDYSGFIRPAELAKACRKHNLEVTDITGIYYNPFNRKAGLTTSPNVNYLLHAKLPEN